MKHTIRAGIPAALIAGSVLTLTTTIGASGTPRAGLTVTETATSTTTEAAELEILPPDEPWGGATRGEWDAQWWQRAFTMPEDISPYFDPTGERCGTIMSSRSRVSPSMMRAM